MKPMTEKTTTTIAWIAVAVLAASGIAAGFALGAKRPNRSPVMSESAFAALGGFRSLAAEAVWFRAERLQDEGRYVELAQLASTLSFLGPHTPEVWSYSAWNLAYNISVMMPTYEDRWRWVKAAISLLRDEGLALNPGSPELCKELAWLFQIKIGADIDSAAELYREKWRAVVRDVAERGAWQELRMEPQRMRKIERMCNSGDWGDPVMSALYWVDVGLEKAKDREAAFLNEIKRQSLVMISKRK